MCVILQTLCQIQHTSSSLRYENCSPGHIQCNYCSAYSGFNIQQNVAPLLLEICRQFTERYTANLVPVPIQRITSSLRNVNCGPGHIKCTYSSIYSGFNIQLNVSALLWEIYRQFNVRYTANIVPNTAHILQTTPSELWSRTYTMELYFCIFKLQYSTERICVDIGVMSTIQCELYCKYGAKYSAHPPDFAMWTVVPDIYNVITAPHIQSSIINSSYLRCYCIYVDHSESVIL
jgi:hypothetical protein